MDHTSIDGGVRSAGRDYYERCTFTTHPNIVVPCARCELRLVRRAGEHCRACQASERAARVRHDLLASAAAWLILLAPASGLAERLTDDPARALLLATALAGIASLFVPLLLTDLAALLRRGGLG